MFNDYAPLASNGNLLREQGFARIHLGEFVHSRNLGRAFKELQASCKRLPPDEDHDGRSRRFGRAIYMAKSRTLYPC